ncbi:hypothetical protein [Aeromonas enterica]
MKLFLGTLFSLIVMPMSALAENWFIEPALYAGSNTTLGVTLKYQADDSVLLWGAGGRYYKHDDMRFDPALELSLARPFFVTKDIDFIMAAGVSDLDPFVEYAMSFGMTPASKLMLGGRVSWMDGKSINELMLAIQKQF